jgi:hypothetical protein
LKKKLYVPNFHCPVPTHCFLPKRNHLRETLPQEWKQKHQKAKTRGAGAITTTAGPAEEVAAAVDFLTECLGVTGVAVDEFVAFAKVFGQVIFVVESAAGALDWTTFEFPIGQR